MIEHFNSFFSDDAILFEFCVMQKILISKGIKIWSKRGELEPKLLAYRSSLQYVWESEAYQKRTKKLEGSLFSGLCKFELLVEDFIGSLFLLQCTNSKRQVKRTGSNCSRN